MRKGEKRKLDILASAENLFYCNKSVPNYLKKIIF